MFLSPDEIPRVRLRRRFRGYHPEDVDHLLRELAAGHAHLVARLEAAENECARLREPESERASTRPQDSGSGRSGAADRYFA